MPTINAIERDGSAYKVAATSGETLKDILKADANLDVPALCGGFAMCGTCHIHVAPEWLSRLPEANEIEATMLDQLAFRDENSRLACQIRMTDLLDGITLTLAKKE